MPKLDEYLREELRRSVRSIDENELAARLARRKARRGVTRQVQSGALALIVVAGAVASFFVLTRVFGAGQREAGAGSKLPGNGMIAYSDVNTATGDGDIFVMNQGGTGATALDQPGDDYSPSWSPDGTQIFFMKAGEGIWSMDADGSNAKQLTDLQTSWLDVSPDGSKIAFDHAIVAIWVMNADGSDAHTIFGPEIEGNGASVSIDEDQVLIGTDDGSTITAERDAQHPSWSPDGTRIAFGSGDGVWVMYADGSGAREVVVEGDLPVWSPDGARLAFVSPDGSQIRYVTLADDGDEGRPVVSAPTVIARTEKGSFRDLGFSPDGTKLLYTLDDPSVDGPQNYEIFAANLDGSDARQLTHLGDDDHAWCCLDPDWQPLP